MRVSTGTYASGNVDAAGTLVGPALAESQSAQSSLTSRAEAINGSPPKRLFDLVLAVALIAGLLPVLLTIALLIVIDCPGPVLFRQERYGRGKRVFLIYKFRTMRVMESTGRFTQACPGDERFTRIGRLLRRTSVDELPQLLNVVRGEMSLVGPRPHALAMDDTFARSIPDFSDRHLVRPGMTGLAQVAGYRGPTLSSHAITQRLRHDRLYIQKWSLWLDLKILARTPLALIQKNAL